MIRLNDLVAVEREFGRQFDRQAREILARPLFQGARQMDRHALHRRIESAGPQELNMIERVLDHAAADAKQAIVGDVKTTSGDMQACGVNRPSHEPLTLDNIDDVMKYQPWDRDQLAAGDVVREAVTAAAKAILRVVPPCRARDKALEQLVGARMDANAALSFRGRF